MAAVSPLLSTHGLSRHFGGLRAVDDVSLELGQGEIRAVIGPNGAGKTTLVSLMCGRLRPSAGLIPTVPSAYLWDDLQVTGTMGRAAADVALSLAALSGPSAASPVAAPP